MAVCKHFKVNRITELLQRLSLTTCYYHTTGPRYCTPTRSTDDTDKDSFQIFGLGAALKKQNEVLRKQKEALQNPDQPSVKKSESFATLLRNSKFIDLGKPEGKKVIGTIVRVVEEDLYIDFGWKFYTVCTRPESNQGFYVPGAKVILLIKSLELSGKFLGHTKELTIAEADCVLLGLAHKKA